MAGTFPPAVKGLYISEEFRPRIAPTLKELVGERVTEVLPDLLAPCWLFSWRRHTYLDPFGKPLGSSLLRDGLPVDVLSFLTGGE